VVVGWAAKDEVVCEHRRPVGPMVDGVAALEPGSSKGGRWWAVWAPAGHR